MTGTDAHDAFSPLMGGGESDCGACGIEGGVVASLRSSSEGEKRKSCSGSPDEEGLLEMTKSSP